MFTCVRASEKDDSDDEDGPKKKICIEELQGEEEPKPTKSHQRAQFQIILIAIRVQREKSESKFTSQKKEWKCAMFFEEAKGRRMS